MNRLYYATASILALAVLTLATIGLTGCSVGQRLTKSDTALLIALAATVAAQQLSPEDRAAVCAAVQPVAVAVCAAP